LTNELLRTMIHFVLSKICVNNLKFPPGGS
jgi:hypothetical protein